MPDRILVARLDSIGDCVLSSAFVAGLRSLFPAAHLTGAFAASTAPLFAHCPLFDRVIPIPIDRPQTWRELIEPPYDIAICPRWDVDYWSTRQLAMMSQAPVRIGFDRGNYRFDSPRDGWAGAYFTELVRTRSDRHEVLKTQNMLQSLGMAGAIPAPKLWLPAEAIDLAARFIERHALDQFTVLAVSAGFANRTWPVENFVSVIEAAWHATGRRFVVLGAADAMAAGEWLQQQFPRTVVSAAGTLPLLTSAAILAAADLYIGADTGLMHIAAASRVPVIEISCHPLTGSADHPNSPFRFGPYATLNRVIQPQRPRAPCTDGCTILHTPHCIAAVEPSRVVEMLSDLMRERAMPAGAAAGGR
jgi:heptosyltransferase-2